MAIFTGVMNCLVRGLRLAHLSGTQLGFGIVGAALLVCQNTKAFADEQAGGESRAGVHSLDDRWRVQLWGKNVTNQYYWTNVASYYDTVARYAGRPATFGISASYNFK